MSSSAVAAGAADPVSEAAEEGVKILEVFYRV